MRPSNRPNSAETNTYSASKSAASTRPGRPLGQAATTLGATPSTVSSSLTTRESSSGSSSHPPLGLDGDALRSVPINNLGMVPSGRALRRVKSAASLRGDVDWVFRGVSSVLLLRSYGWLCSSRVGVRLRARLVGLAERSEPRARLDAPLVPNQAPSSPSRRRAVATNDTPGAHPCSTLC